MLRLNQLCLILGAFAWVAQPHECSGNNPPSELISHVKFELHCSSLAFADEDVDNIDGVTSNTDCANYCAANPKCQVAVWKENTGRCALKTALDEFSLRDNHHSLVKVGFINGTDIGGSGCSQRELHEKCAAMANAESSKAKAECLKQVQDAQRDALQDRTDRERVERECGDRAARLEQSLRDTKRECRENLEKEIAERDRAVRAERERIERKARGEQDRAVQEERDRLTREFNEKLRAEREAKGDQDRVLQEERDRLTKEFNEKLRAEREAWALAANKCTADREKALEAERDRLGKECNEKLRLEQIISSNKCSADLRNEQDRSTKDCSERLRLEQVHSDSKCSANLRAEQDRLYKECSERLRSEKELVEGKCSADLGRVTEERDRLSRQCSDDLRSVREEKDRSETKCKQDLQEKDRSETRCKQDLQEKDRSETRCKQDLQEKDRLTKECTDGRAQEQTRRKDDICFNPGFGAWPNTITAFDIDGNTYVVQPNSHLTLAVPIKHDTTSPASCARDYCNNQSDCVGVEWTPNDNQNKCTIYIESPYRPIKKADIRKDPNNYMIFKQDRLR